MDIRRPTNEEKRPCKNCGFNFNRNELGSDLLCTKCYIDKHSRTIQQVALKKVHEKEKTDKNKSQNYACKMLLKTMYEEGYINKDVYQNWVTRVDGTYKII